MSIQEYNIYIIGVGGQGIGLLSETLHRAIDHAGIPCKGVDTHGLAQRGGTVTSHVRMGSQVFSPLIRPGQADLVIALERHEALRGLNDTLKDEGSLIFYDAVWQPLNVRMKKEKEIKTDQVLSSAKQRKVKAYRVFLEELKDARMQNIALLAWLCKEKIVPMLEKEHFLKALEDVLPDNILNKNMELFRKITEL